MAFLSGLQVDVGGLTLLTKRRTDLVQDTIWVAIKIERMRHEASGVVLIMDHTHVTNGKYTIEVQPDRKKLNTRDKVERLLAAKTAELQKLILRPTTLWLSQGVHGDDPATSPVCFNLRYAQPHGCYLGMDALASQCEAMMSGVFKPHGTSRRSMTGLPGPNFHISIYDGFHVHRPGA